MDDKPSNNKTLQNALIKKNMQIDIACTTEKGLELYEQNLYDLIITDMVYTARSAILNYGDQAKKLGAAVTNKREILLEFISDKLKTRVSV